MGPDRATRVALARWAVISEAADERLAPAERGRVIFEAARRVHRDADGRQVRITSRTIYRWLAAWRTDGFEGLKPARRRDGECQMGCVSGWVAIRGWPREEFDHERQHTGDAGTRFGTVVGVDGYRARGGDRLDH